MIDHMETSEGIKDVDNTSATIPRHKMKRSVDDEFDTEERIYYPLIQHWDIIPELDVFSGEHMEGDTLKSNSKCIYSFTIRENAFETEWLLPDGSKPTGIWWNDPHSLHKETLERSLNQWLKHDLDILGIIPGNTVRPPFFYNNVLRYLHRGIEIEPVIDYANPSENGGYMRFEKRGKPTEHISVNGYLAIRYFSKDSWTRFLKKQKIANSSYGKCI